MPIVNAIVEQNPNYK
jgi:E3 ubiquitin-protein ligase EDD1